MSALLENLNGVAATWLPRLTAVAWQWSLFVLLAAVLLMLVPQARSPSLRYWAWQIMLVKLLAMPVLGFTLALAWLPAPVSQTLEPPRAIPVAADFGSRTDLVADDRSFAEASKSARRAASPSLGSVPRPRFTFPAWLVVLWAAVVALQFARLLWQKAALARTLDDAHPADEPIQRIVRQAASALGLAQPPAALVTEGDGSPFVCGVARAKLVMPRCVLASLAPPQLHQVVLHELAHVRRRDLLWGWVPEIARIVWWFHPVVHWVVFRLRLERELACDQWAMSLTSRDSADYAATLVHVASRSSIPIAAAALVVPATGPAPQP
ncbi:MAG: M56 family metallopeptidase [Planctomycetaceae bacterium]